MEGWILPIKCTPDRINGEKYYGKQTACKLIVKSLFLQCG